MLLSGVRWDFLRQRHQILATLFARAGYPTVFVETTGLSNPGVSSLGKVVARLSRSSTRESPKTNLRVYSPLVLPPMSRVFRGINARLFVPKVARDISNLFGLFGRNGEAPLVVAYPPTRTTLDLLSRLAPRTVLYDCSDEYAAFPGAPRDIAGTERELLSRADLVSCTSERLLRRVEKTRPDAFLSGPAVDFDLFGSLPERKRGDGRLVVCLFGDVRRERIDFEALRSVASAGFELRVVGEAGRRERAVLERLGADYRGVVAHRDLPLSLSGADAFILPYRKNRLTDGVSPAKTFECLATGRPVICAPLPALRSLGERVYLAEKPGDYARVLKNLPGTESEERIRQRRDFARENSWEARFSELEERIWRELEG